LAYYTDKAALFQTAEKSQRGESAAGKDRKPMPPTQIGRALQELGIQSILAHSPQAKGRVERGFATAQDRLVKGMRAAGVRTREQANRYLETEFMPWWNQTLVVRPASAEDAHRPLEKHHDLVAILSHVETRQVNNDYTIQFDAKIYQIARKDIGVGLRGAVVRVERRRDATVAVRFRDRYLCTSPCDQRPQVTPSKPAPPRSRTKPARGSEWNQNFDLKKAPKVWQAAQSSGAKPEQESL